MTRAEIVVDLAAIRNNVRRLRTLLGVPMMTVVKADGYGHGLLPSARAARAGGAEWLGVASLAEALALREGGDTGRVLCWLLVPSDDVVPAVRAGIETTAYTAADLARLADAATSTGLRPRVQLKIDTGLSRGGATAAQWPGLVAEARRLERAGLVKVTGIWSHLSTSEVPEDPANEAQERAFAEACAVAAEAGLHPEVRHLANSAGSLLRPSSRFDLVRVGLAAYGLDPMPGLAESPWPSLGLRPAMTVRAELALVKEIAAEESVSYGHTWTADRPTTLGLVPVGYADGILRAAGNRAEAWVAGARRPVRGAVCMDQLVVDLGGDLPGPGAEVVLWGSGLDGRPTAEDWARAAGTISYEVVTRVGGRMTRRYVDSDAEPDAA
ncbi:MAG: alanine racemase [Nocardioides sp.]|uniref:alanine racemase n=1 Tax=Nocardioides sp. TaxID=35761 RepID=UPI0039E23240